MCQLYWCMKAPYWIKSNICCIASFFWCQLECRFFLHLFCLVLFFKSAKREDGARRLEVQEEARRVIIQKLIFINFLTPRERLIQMLHLLSGNLVIPGLQLQTV